MSKVAIVGAGFIGRAWAVSFARAGHAVALWDEDTAAPARALSYIEGLLPDLAAQDLLNGHSAADVLARIRGVAGLEEALAGPSMCRRTRRKRSRSSAPCLRGWTLPQHPVPSWRVRPPRSCRPPSPKPWRTGRAVLWCIRSIRLI